MSDPKRQTEQDEGLALDERPPEEPKKYAVFFLNDHYTTMEFVLEVLQRFFAKTPDQSYEIMMKVHKEGKGLAGIYSYEIAETKVHQTESLARERGYPLRCEIEPIET